MNSPPVWQGTPLFPTLGACDMPPFSCSRGSYSSDCCSDEDDIGMYMIAQRDYSSDDEPINPSYNTRREYCRPPSPPQTRYRNPSPPRSRYTRSPSPTTTTTRRTNGEYINLSPPTVANRRRSPSLPRATRRNREYMDLAPHRSATRTTTNNRSPTHPARHYGQRPSSPPPRSRRRSPPPPARSRTSARPNTYSYDYEDAATAFGDMNLGYGVRNSSDCRPRFASTRGAEPIYVYEDELYSYDAHCDCGLGAY